MFPVRAIEIDELAVAVRRGSRYRRASVDGGVGCTERESNSLGLDLGPPLEAVERAVSRLYPNVTVDLAGHKQAAVRVEPVMACHTPPAPLPVVSPGAMSSL